MTLRDDADRHDRGVGVGEPQFLQRLAGDVAGRNPEAGHEAVGGLEVTPERPDVSRLEPGQDGIVHVADLVGGQRPRYAATAIEVVRQPLGGGSQGAGHRIAGSNSADIVLWIHPNHQPGVALFDGAPVTVCPEVIANGRLDALGGLTGADRDDVDAIETNVELPQRRNNGFEWDGGRQCVAVAMPTGLTYAVDGDHRDQFAAVLADAHRLAAELSPVVDRRSATDSQRLRVGVPVSDPGDRGR
jgi:hypothetical protein